MNTINWAPWVAGLQILFGVTGLLTGWIPGTEAMTILFLGLSVFGFHSSNVALGRKLGAR